MVLSLRLCNLSEIALPCNSIVNLVIAILMPTNTNLLVVYLRLQPMSN